MTIHGPGTPIYMSEIQAEFGGAVPYYLSQYYAGGGRVPAGTSGYYGPIPASGTISLRDFYGASNYTPPVIVDSTSMLAGSGAHGTGFLNAAVFGGDAFGSLSDANFAPYGQPIYAIRSVAGGGGQELWFSVNFINPSSGWEVMGIEPGGYTFPKGLAAYTTTTAPGGVAVTNWAWPTTGHPLPIPVFVPGQTYTITWYP